MPTSASRPPRRVAGQRARERAVPPPAAAPTGTTRLPRRRHREPAVRPPGTPTAAVRRPARTPWAALTAVVVALVLLTSVLVWTRTRPALASPADQVAATGSASTTLEQLLSYSYSSFDDHVAQVEPQLADPFKGQYASAAGGKLKALAQQNQTVVQARVLSTGVMDTTASTVRVLAFVNQATTTKAQPDPQVDQNRVIATMTKGPDGRWLVSDLQAF